MLSILLDEPGKRVLMMGNEAIARGAIEAGVKFCAAYPGSPTSEIIGTLARPEVAESFAHHAEWSTNEIVALEAAAVHIAAITRWTRAHSRECSMRRFSSPPVSRRPRR